MEYLKARYILLIMGFVFVICLWHFSKQTTNEFNLQLRYNMELGNEVLLGWKDGHLTNNDDWETMYEVGPLKFMIIPGFPYRSISLSSGLNSITIYGEVDKMTLFIYDNNNNLYGTKEITINNINKIELEYNDFKLKNAK